MKYTIKFEEGTLADFQKAVERYEKVSDNLANRFHKEFWRKIDYIKENPLHHQIRYREIRIAHIKVFPFGIHFLVDETTIRVFKILHHKQYYK
uniref:type II toxin-antitoxin system RelE/ParE family toxin n=1 Tax=Mariniflexile sp. TaxID=1979402 RepID=UPI0040478B4C